MRSALFIAAAAEPGTIFGTWLTESRKGQIEIYPCGTQACGRLVPRLGSGAAPPRAPANGFDTAQHFHDRTILWNFTPSQREAGVWEDGRIMDPRDGAIYRATMTLEPDERLRVRGYLGVSLVGQNQYWTRVK